MRVCLVRHAYFPEDPRDRKQAYALAERGHSVSVVCLRRAGQRIVETVNGVRVYRVPLAHARKSLIRYCAEYVFSFLVMTALLNWIYFVKRHRVVQVSTMPDFLVFSTFIPWIAGARVLLDLHEPMPELWVTKFGTHRLGFVRRVLARIERLAVGFSDGVITVTGTIRRRFIERGAPAGKIAVVPNVCEESFERAGDEGADAPPPADGFVVVTHGLIAERYGHETLVRAAARARDHIPGLRVVIPGKGDFAPRLAELVDELGLGDTVQLPGFVSREELMSILRDANVGVVAMYRSPYSELIDTNKMYEYIALHKPVVCSRLPGVEETFDDSCIAFFEPGDHAALGERIRELHDRPEARASLARNAHARFERIRWSRSKVAYAELVEDLARR